MCVAEGLGGSPVKVLPLVRGYVPPLPTQSQSRSSGSTGSPSFLANPVPPCVCCVWYSGKSVSNGVQWDPMGGTVDVAALEGADAIIHLAGTPHTHSLLTHNSTASS